MAAVWTGLQDKTCCSLMQTPTSTATHMCSASQQRPAWHDVQERPATTYRPIWPARVHETCRHAPDWACQYRSGPHQLAILAQHLHRLLSQQELLLPILQTALRLDLHLSVALPLLGGQGDFVGTCFACKQPLRALSHLGCTKVMQPALLENPLSL